MKKILPGKQLFTVLLTLGISVGCASSPKEPAAPTAEQVSQAISEARAAVAEAGNLDWVWRDTQTYLLSAEGTAKEDPAGALKLANKARNQAQLAVNQYYLEHAKAMLDASSNSGQDATLAAADAAIHNAEGRKAYDMLKPLASN